MRQIQTILNLLQAEHDNALSLAFLVMWHVACYDVAAYVESPLDTAKKNVPCWIIDIRHSATNCADL